MSQLADVQTFIDLSRQVSSAADLHFLMRAVTKEIGFDHYALIHHVDLSPFSHNLSHIERGELLMLTDYPESWVERYVANNIVSNDPVLLASQRTNCGFCWEDVPGLIKLTSALRQITEDTRKAGILNGFTVPAHVPGEANGSCNFAMSRHQEAPKHNFGMAQLIGSFAFQAARSLILNAQSVNLDPVQLTNRQLECVALVARGKSDWEIGCILGVSEETVKKHLRDARERYDVPKRVQVVLRAVFDGQLPLAEIVK